MDNCLRTKEAGRNPGKMRTPSSGKFSTRMSRSVQPLIRDTPVCQQRSRQESIVRTRNVSVPPTWVARVDATHWPNDRWVARTHVPGGSAIPARGARRVTKDMPQADRPRRLGCPISEGLFQAFGLQRAPAPPCLRWRWGCPRTCRAPRGRAGRNVLQEAHSCPSGARPVPWSTSSWTYMSKGSPFGVSCAHTFRVVMRVHELPDASGTTSASPIATVVCEQETDGVVTKSVGPSLVDAPGTRIRTLPSGDAQDFLFTVSTVS